tara:strand:- start:306 stop:935 length:630 start_codon:yes stop_codon:yes gene_type:complete
MSGLSHKSHGELNQITANIMINEGIRGAIKAAGSRALGYARGTLSPIIKKNLGLDPKQGLAKGLLDKGLQGAADVGSKLARDAAGGAKSVLGATYRQARGVGKKIVPLVPFAAATYGVGQAVNDLQKPKGQSVIRGFFGEKPKYQKEEVELLSEEAIQECSEILYGMIGGYLIEKGLADDVDKAHAIMENMSDTWAEDIIQEVALADDE